jgi:phosphatidylglycerophosphate synthase
MKRPFVFLLLGPSSVAATFLLATLCAEGARSTDFAQLCSAALFVFALPVSAITGLIDGYLARALPLASRAPLTALAGAMIAVTPVLALLHGSMLRETPLISTWFAIGGALSMGACSLLSHD